MSIELMCPRCGAINAFGDEKANQMGQCGRCATPIFIPEPNEVQDLRLPQGQSNLRQGRSNPTLRIAVAAASVLLALGLLAGGIYFLFPWRKADDPLPAAQLAAENAKDAFAAAPVVKLEANVLAFHEGKIEQARGETIVKLKAPAAGTLVVQFDSDGNKMDGLLIAYDAARKELVRNDPDAEKRVGQIFVPVKANQEFFVKASCADDAAGSFKLSFMALSGAGNDDFARALEVKLSRKGEATQTWKIEPAGDVDYFRCTAPHDGHLEVELKPANDSKLDAVLWALDPSRQPIMAHVAPGSSEPRKIRFNVESGKNYHVKVEACRGTPLDRQTGAYALTFRMGKGSLVGYGAAQEVFLDAISGNGKAFGWINQPKDARCFRLKANRTGMLRVKLEYPQGSALHAWIACSGANFKDLGYNEDSLAFPVTAGSTYFVNVGSVNQPRLGRQRSGAFEIAFTTTTFPPYREEVALNADGAAENVFGELKNAKDPVDTCWFRFKAPVNGTMEVILDYPVGSELHAMVSGCDALKTSFGASIFSVMAGNTYFVRVRAWPFKAPERKSTGAFTLKFVTTKNDDLGIVREVALDGSGRAAKVSGQIKNVNDASWFRFKATSSGVMEVKLTYPQGSALAGVVTAYFSGKSAKIAFGHDNQFPVIAGRTYHVKVTPDSLPAFGRARAGAFLLKFDTAIVDEIALDNTGAVADVRGAVGAGPAWLRFKAPISGDLTLEANERPAGSQLNALPIICDFTRKTSDLHHLAVTAGKFYYIKMAPPDYEIAPDARKGAFSLKLFTLKNDFGAAGEITLNEAGAGKISDEIQVATDVFYYRFKAPISGKMTVDVARLADKANPKLGSKLDAFVRVYDSLEKPLHPWSFPVQAGNTYYVRVASRIKPYIDHSVPGFVFLKRTGAFTLSFVTVKNAGEPDKAANVPANSFVSKEGRFRFDFPAIPKQDTKTFLDGSAVKSFSADAGKEPGTYGVSYCDLPNPVGHSDEARKAHFDVSRDSALKAVKATLIRESDITFAGKYPGREVDATIGQFLHVRFRVILADGQRVYSIVLIGSEAWIRSAEASRVMNSFAILPR